MKVKIEVKFVKLVVGFEVLIVLSVVGLEVPFYT